MHPQQAELAELRKDLLGELGPFEPAVDLGQDPFVHPVPDGLADHPFLVREERVDVQNVDPSPQLQPRCQTKRHRRHRTEQPISAHDQRKQLRALLPRTRHELPIGRHQRQ